MNTYSPSSSWQSASHSWCFQLSSQCKVPEPIDPTENQKRKRRRSSQNLWSSIDLKLSYMLGAISRQRKVWPVVSVSSQRSSAAPIFSEFHAYRLFLWSWSLAASLRLLAWRLPPPPPPHCATDRFPITWPHLRILREPWALWAMACQGCWGHFLFSRVHFKKIVFYFLAPKPARWMQLLQSIDRQSKFEGMEKTNGIV